jgi:hypothetical protein
MRFFVVIAFGAGIASKLWFLIGLGDISLAG